AVHVHMSRRGLNLLVWLVMLGVTVLEVSATYLRPAMPTLLTALLVLAAAQAGLGLVYFMHLRHERKILGWSMVGALIFVLTMMNQIWPDGLRVYWLRLH
ncbi:MAG: cytochrome C oxidase subunit IV family protein, partial [Tepidiformaceae bacterium]